MTKNELIQYIATLLNLDTTPDYIYMDVSEELTIIKDYSLFIKEFKSLLGTLKQQLEYKTAFQKFVFIMQHINDKKLELTDSENDFITAWCDNLFSKLTWYFDELAFLKPTKEQLNRQIWKNHIYKGVEMINEKESQVCDIIGDTKEIYRLVTQNKPLLQSKIREIVMDLRKKKKQGIIQIEDKSNPIVKLMHNAKP